MGDFKKLEPELKSFLQKINHLNPSLKEMGDVEKGRRDYLNFALYHAGWPLPLARVEDKSIPSADPHEQLPIRIYTPKLETVLPALVYFHGGGWQRGDIATHDSICRHLAHIAGCIVISVQWRLAPEYPFPIGLNDAFAAYQWIAIHGRKLNINTSFLAVGGDSAGGNIAAALTLILRDQPIEKPVFQLLIYPSLDLSCQGQSYKDYAEGFFLTTERVKFYISQYIRSPEDIHDPLCSPLKAPLLGGLPPAHIVTCGFDPLKDEGQAYAQRLQDAGVPTTYQCYESLIHASFHMNDTVPFVQNALQDVGEVLQQGFKMKK